MASLYILQALYIFLCTQTEDSDQNWNQKLQWLEKNKQKKQQLWDIRCLNRTDRRSRDSLCSPQLKNDVLLTCFYLISVGLHSQPTSTVTQYKHLKQRDSEPGQETALYRC